MEQILQPSRQLCFVAGKSFRHIVLIITTSSVEYHDQILHPDELHHRSHGEDRLLYSCDCRAIGFIISAHGVHEFVSLCTPAQSHQKRNS